MKFKKGVSGNPAGRPPGGTHAAARAVRARFAQLLEVYSPEQMKADLEAITDPKERLGIMLGLASFCHPQA